MRKLLIYIVVGVALVSPLSGSDFTVQLQRVGLQVPPPGLESVDFDLENTRGETVSLSSLKGKIVFLNFWATWCGPCREEMPSMQQLYEAYADKGLEILAVNLMEDGQSVERFARELSLTFPMLLDRQGRVGSIYGARAIPTTYLIDRDGYVIAGMTGSRNWFSREVRELFDSLLEPAELIETPFAR